METLATGPAFCRSGYDIESLASLSSLGYSRQVSCGEDNFHECKEKSVSEGQIADVHRSWPGGGSWNFTTSFLAGCCSAAAHAATAGAETSRNATISKGKSLEHSARRAGRRQRRQEGPSSACVGIAGREPG